MQTLIAGGLILAFAIIVDIIICVGYEKKIDSLETVSRLVASELIKEKKARMKDREDRSEGSANKEVAYRSAKTKRTCGECIEFDWVTGDCPFGAYQPNNCLEYKTKKEGQDSDSCGPRRSRRVPDPGESVSRNETREEYIDRLVESITMDDVRRFAGQFGFKKDTSVSKKRQPNE